MKPPKYCHSLSNVYNNQFSSKHEHVKESCSISQYITKLSEYLFGTFAKK